MTSPEPFGRTPTNAKARGEYWQQKRESIIFRSLHERIALIRNLMNGTLRVEREEIIELLDGSWKILYERLPQEIRDSFLEQKRIKEEYIALDGRLQTNKDVDSTIEGVYPTNSEEMQVESLLARSAELSADDVDGTIEFITGIESLKNNLIEKCKLINQLKSSPDVLGIIEQQLAIPGLAEHVVAVNEDNPFAFALIVDEKFFPVIEDSLHVKRGGRGVFFRGTALCFIRSDIQDIEKTIRHEQLHAMTDGILNAKDSSDMLDVCLSQRSKLIPESLRARLILDCLQNELVAAVEQAVSVNFGKHENSADDKSHPEESFPESLARFILVLKTAGGQFYETIEDFDRRRAKTDVSADEKKELVMMRESYIRLFYLMAHALEKTSELIQSVLPPALHKDAVEEMLIGMCILQPSNYRHLPIYMMAWIRDRQEVT